METFHLTDDGPSDPDARTRRRAEAIHLALTHAVASPGFRLDLILGEGCGRILDVARWVATEFARDEPKAPGLTALATTRALRLDAAAWARQITPLLLSAAIGFAPQERDPLIEPPTAGVTSEPVPEDGDGSL